MIFVGRVAIPEYKSISWTFEWMVLLNWNSKQTRWFISDDELGIPLLCVLDHAFVDGILMPVAIPTCFFANRVSSLSTSRLFALRNEKLCWTRISFHRNYPLMQRRQIIVDDEIAIFNLCLFGPGCRVSISLSVHATLVSKGMQTGTSLHFWSHAVWLFFDSGSMLGTCSPG